MQIAPSWSSWYSLPTMKRQLVLVSPSSVEHILYARSVMIPPFIRIGYSKLYWFHGLEREARIEAAGVCFDGCEWVSEWVSCLSYDTETNGECWENEEDCSMIRFQLQIGEMMIVSIHDGIGYSVEWCLFGGMIISKKQRECAEKWYLSVVWKQQRLQVVLLLTG